MPRTGRRPGESGTRDAILAAARARFAEDGYRGATIRAIAQQAGVDPALVHHFFGSKQDLFAAVLDLPMNPQVVREALLGAPADEIGWRVVEMFLAVWDEPARRQQLQLLIRTALSDESAARMIREFLVDELFGPVAAHFGTDRPDLRATLVGSQMIGFALMRYLLHLEPLASADHDEIVSSLAPTIQRYLTEAL